MEAKDCGLEKVDKREIKQSICVFYGSPEAKLGRTMEVMSPEALSKGTEGHHASHALTFFSYMAYNVVKGKGIRQHLLRRVIQHLKGLQEFIENPELNVLVKSMIESIHIQYGKFSEDAEQSAETIRRWLVSNQESILKLAECYRKQSVFDGLLPFKAPVESIKVTGTASHDLQDRHHVTEGRLLDQLFRGYFNNKMSVIVFLIQIKRLSLNEKSTQLACGFLDDMYRHMLSEGLQRKYRLMFLWLKKFFLKLPDVTIEQRNKAIGFIRSLYEIFGIKLNEGGQV